MKKIYLLALIMFITSCTIREKPIFLKVDQVRLSAISNDTLTIGAKVSFKNPNDIGGKIIIDKVKVLVNKTEVAMLYPLEFKVPSDKEFSIPLKAAVPIEKIYRETPVLTELLSSLFNRSLKVEFKGNLRYQVLGFSYIYPIDQVEEVEIKF